MPVRVLLNSFKDSRQSGKHNNKDKLLLIRLHETQTGHEYNSRMQYETLDLSIIGRGRKDNVIKGHDRFDCALFLLPSVLRIQKPFRYMLYRMCMRRHDIGRQPIERTPLYVIMLFQVCVMYFS